MFVRRKPRVRLEPIQSGGGQERGLRSGTVPTPIVVGFGEACRIAKQEMEVNTIYLIYIIIHLLTHDIIIIHIMFFY